MSADIIDLIDSALDEGEPEEYGYPMCGRCHYEWHGLATEECLGSDIEGPMPARYVLERRGFIRNDNGEMVEVDVYRRANPAPEDVVTWDRFAVGGHLEHDHGGALYAAGAWCAPSEQIYSFTDMGIGSAVPDPDITIPRGGIRYPAGGGVMQHHTTQPTPEQMAEYDRLVRECNGGVGFTDAVHAVSQRIADELGNIYRYGY